MTRMKAATGVVAGLMALVAAGSLRAQDEVLTGQTAPAGPEWRVFSQSDASSYLIDMTSIRSEEGEVRVRVARVSKRLEAGNLNHVIDEFGIRCASNETHVVTSTEVYEDGETSESFASDEPWTVAGAGSFDEAVKDIGCGEMVPRQDAFPAVRAFIEAGRP